MDSCPVIFGNRRKRSSRWHALGAYDYQEAGWQIWGGISGKEPSGGIGCGSTGSSGFLFFTKIDRSEQDKLIGAWVDWLKTVEVRQVRSHAPQKPFGHGEEAAKITLPSREETPAEDDYTQAKKLGYKDK